MPHPSHSSLVRGFTLIELIVSTALALVLLSLATTLWFAVQTRVERTRAIVSLDARMRVVSERLTQAMDIKTGVLPMSAQNHASSIAWSHQLRIMAANSHLDPTARNVGNMAWTDPKGIRIDYRWHRPSPPEWLGWRSLDRPEPATFDVAAGQKVLKGTIGDNSHYWQQREIAFFHASVVKYQGVSGANPRGVTRGGAAPSSGNPWKYQINVSNRTFGAQSESSDSAAPNSTAQETARRLAARSLFWAPSIPGGRYTAKAISQQIYLGSGLSYAVVLPGVAPTLPPNPRKEGPQRSGPFRGSSIAPYYTGSTFIPWLGKTHLMRIINGPAYAFERWLPMANPRAHPTRGWIPIGTGDYGRASKASHYEPNWYGEVSPTFVTGQLDPAANQPVPAYGSLIEETNVPAGSVPARWRVEAPPLGMSDSPTALFRASAISNSDPMAAILSSTMHNIWPDKVDESLVDDLRLQRFQFAPNISGFRVTTSRMRTGFQGAIDGRFGCLSNVSWTQDSGTTSPDAMDFVENGMFRYIADGFFGNQPTATESPGHPRWVSVEFGAVGGFTERGNGSAIDRRWTITMNLQ